MNEERAKNQRKEGYGRVFYEEKHPNIPHIKPRRDRDRSKYNADGTLK